MIGPRHNVVAAHPFDGPVSERTSKGASRGLAREGRFLIEANNRQRRNALSSILCLSG
jgi:hypothetical protein